MAKRTIPASPSLEAPRAQRALWVAPEIGDDGAVWIRWEAGGKVRASGREALAHAARRAGAADGDVATIVDAFLGSLPESDIALAPLFANIAAPKSSDVQRLIDCVVFWRLFGPAVICEHLLPAGHCGFDSSAGRTPFAAILHYASLIRDVLRAGTEALERPGKGFGRQAEERYPALARLASGDPLSKPRLLRGVVERALTWFFLITPMQLVASWEDPGNGPVLRVVGSAGSLPAILWDMVVLLSGTGLVEECTGCGALIDVRTRRRATPKSQYPWCDACKAANKHKRHSEQMRAGD